MEEITHAQLSYDAQHQPQYIVHHIQYGTPSNFTQTVNKALLQEGANLVKQVRTEEIWHNVEIKAGYHTPALIISSRIVTLSQPPPQATIYQAAPAVTKTLRDWLEPPTDEEIYALDDLEEFESTDLSGLLCITYDNGSQFQGKKRCLPLDSEHSEDFDQDKPSRKILRLDSDSLLRVIPQPHIQLSNSFIPPRFDAIQAYDRTQTIFLPPYTGPLPSTNDDFSRRAWIIPARGYLPSAWSESGASSAVVLDPEEPGSSLEMTTTGSTIKWSHFALKEFWKYLNTLRDLKKLGSLGISFQPAQSASLRLRREKENLSSLGSPDAHQLQGLHVAESLSQSLQSSTPSGASSSLRDCDYFKVYHDAKISMHLRRALDLFTFRLGANEEQSVHLEQFEKAEFFEQSRESGVTSSPSSVHSKETENPEGEGRPKRKKPKYCLLRGARLVLVDERSRGVLIA
ncbi:hypothetical protein F5879DRAFT_126827 [Lentinula edodes]|uniref:uncharacterized protein n=1 Tax=Lentinula edodes TaxID=5353 RepID=UPI001E8D9BE9|nr:uncharacterized protein C8R40DRAFT_1066488 [Lentinula edodes]KAH7879408.1 hypothetical protein C8R40DRAFT_1066488 [Lentinula edodes]KAJ3903712.1 hypothetical protein F5879DRAFT_126827 [Lentinula edodes]